MNEAPTISKRRRLVLLLPAALFASFCVFVSWDADQGGRWFGQINAIPYGDKLGHFSLMAIATFLSNIALRGRALRGVLVGSLAVFVLITLEEVRQHFVPMRSFSIGDLVANTLGIALADACYRWVRKRSSAKNYSMTESRDSNPVSE